MTQRCDWAGPSELYIDYHDSEWGVPERGSRALWEQLVLEGFQAGLSWITILKKRDSFRAAFAGFEPGTIAGWGDAEVQRLMQDSGIVRHRGKIEGTIRNARAWQRVEADIGFATYLWNFVDGTPIQNGWQTVEQVPPSTALSAEISKDLRKRGFVFCGPTTAYAFMQAAGLVNDHLACCFRHREVAAMGKVRS